MSPLPRAIPLPLPRGRLRGGPRVRATGRPWGAAPPKPPTLFFTENTLNNTPLIPHILVNTPPSPREGGRERSEQGDARNSPQHPPPSPFAQPVGAVREPPLPPPNPPPSQKYPLPQQRVPSPASHSPPPPRGRLRGGPRVRATGRPWGAGHHPNHHPPTRRRSPSNNQQRVPSPARRERARVRAQPHPSSGVSQSTPISKCPLFS